MDQTPSLPSSQASSVESEWSVDYGYSNIFGSDPRDSNESDEEYFSTPPSSASGHSDDQQTIPMAHGVESNISALTPSGSQDSESSFVSLVPGSQESIHDMSAPGPSFTANEDDLLYAREYLPASQPSSSGSEEDGSVEAEVDVPSQEHSIDEEDRSSEADDESESDSRSDAGSSETTTDVFGNSDRPLNLVPASSQPEDGTDNPGSSQESS